MKKIKDYLHLYLDANVKCRCFSLADREGWISNLDVYLIIDFFDADSEIYAVMPILRKLEDMREEESGCLQKFGGSWGITNRKYALERMFGSPHHGCHGVDVAALTAHLLSKGFDLFGLIDAGLAVNAKDLKV